MIQLKLAELRKKNHLTQQELGEILGVSYQTISKWENAAALPDISVLPAISSYFGVSVDALLGLVPLEQEYRSSDTGKAVYWESRLEYLRQTRKTIWNDDYIQFLIRDVWKLEKPVSILDCGCGYGALGLLMMPLMPAGSTYTGIDFSQTMIETAKETFSHAGLDAKFILSDIMEYPAREKYDMVVSQAVLRHVDHGERFLQKMAEHVKEGGMLVSLECNREFEANGLYIQGMDYGKLCRQEGLKHMWQTELEMQDRDYSIAMKIPHYMKALGFRDVSCRMNDRVNFVEPRQPEYEEALYGCISMDRWAEEKTERETEDTISFCMNHGMSRKEAEDYCSQQNSIAEYLKKQKGEAALTKFTGIMISYGWK